MKKKKTKQISLINVEHPFESVNYVFFKDRTFEKICFHDVFKIKKFLGSDWTIKDSGFIFYGPNNIDVSFNLINIENNDFNLTNEYLITHFNGIKFNKEIIILFSLIRNTANNNTVIEFRLEYDKDEDLYDLKKYIQIPFMQKITGQILSKLDMIFSDILNKPNDIIIINHSFVIKKNFKDTFNFFYNWNNMAKSIKTDKVWKIISEDNKQNNKKYKNFYIIINENIKIYYQVVSIDEIKDQKIEITYNKSSNSYPSLNNYIKFSFFNITNDLCFFLYETHLPINISSSIYETVSYYVYYCNKKTKKYIEDNSNAK